MSVIPVIIPFYKEHEKLRKCAAAIAAQTQAGCEMFVRDNTHDNILWTAAVNEGLAKYCYREDVRYVIVLNQDAYMEKDCVRQLVAFMDANPSCGIACPIQYVETGPSMRWSGPGNTVSFQDTRVVSWGGSLQAFPNGVHRTAPIASYKEPFETYWANGACMMIRVQAVRECGMFDRSMRFICSDADFSFTARARGWKVSVVPGALCEHSLGASAGSEVSELTLVKLHDAVYFAEKWLTGGVYRRLAMEGPDVTPIVVRQWLAAARNQMRKAERRLGHDANSATAPLLSLFARLHFPPEPPRRGRF